MSILHKPRPATDERAVKVVRRTKIETTYEYVPILGEILGFWRTVEVGYIGHRVELHLLYELDQYDRLFINNKEIKLPPAPAPDLRGLREV